jgi:hypothetical protein
MAMIPMKRKRRRPLNMDLSMKAKKIRMVKIKNLLNRRIIKLKKKKNFIRQLRK